MLRFIRGLPLFVLLVSLLFIISPAQAQFEPTLRISRIDVQNFPDVTLYLRGENLEANLSELPVTLSENRQPIANFNPQVQVVGTQSAFLLDASGSVSDPGVTGQLRYLEVAEVTRRLVDLGLLSVEADWLAAYAPDESGDVTTVHAWTRDHGGVANLLQEYEPPSNIDLETPLFDLIFFALDRFDQPDVPLNTAKRIVLFSDGITGSSDLRLDDAVRRAEQEKVPVHTVLLGPETEEGRRNMNRIADLTGGEAYQITSREAVDDLWYILAAGGEQLALTYRSQLRRPEQVLASVTLPNGVPVDASKKFPIVDPQPVQINITAPTNDWRIEKEAPEHDTPVEELDPQMLDIQVEFLWPSGLPARRLKRVEYVIGNNTQVREEEPFNQISFPIDRLDQGDYTIRVIAIDELDIRNDSLPLSFRVNVERPPAPPAGGPVVELFGVFVPINTLLIIITLFLSLLALIVALRKPTVRERVIEAVSNTVQYVTEPFRLNRSQAARDPEVKATLTVQDPGRATSLPSTINVYAGTTTRIGRTPEFADIVIEDKRVSRVHCRMAEEPDGKLRLYDEGGKSGTYVNFDPVKIEGRVLESGDLVNVGPVKFRFDYQSDYHNNEKTYLLSDNTDNNTEPFQPVVPS